VISKISCCTKNFSDLYAKGEIGFDTAQTLDVSLLVSDASKISYPLTKGRKTTFLLGSLAEGINFCGNDGLA
jgi:hypothetical protein